MIKRYKGSIKKESIFRLAKLGISTALIILILSKVNFNEIMLNLKSIRPFYLIAAFILYFIVVSVCSYKWGLLLRAQGLFLPLSKLILFYFIGIFFNMFMPGSSGGDVVRVYELSKYTKRLPESLASIFVERLTGLLAIVSIALIVLLLTPGIIQNRNVAYTAGGFLLISLFVSLILFNQRLAKKLSFIFNPLFNFLDFPLFQRFSFSNPRKKFKELYFSLHLYKRHKKVISKVISLSFLAQGITILSYFLISLSFDFGIDLRYFFLLIPIIAIVKMLPISINGIGVSEGAFVLFFTPLGVSISKAILLSLLIFTFLTAFSLIGGVIYGIKGYLKTPEYQ